MRLIRRSRVGNNYWGVRELFVPLVRYFQIPCQRRDIVSFELSCLRQPDTVCYLVRRGRGVNYLLKYVQKQEGINSLI